MTLSAHSSALSSLMNTSPFSSSIDRSVALHDKSENPIASFRSNPAMTRTTVFNQTQAMSRPPSGVTSFRAVESELQVNSIERDGRA